MLPYYQIENNVVEEKPVKRENKKCRKCEIEINLNNYMKNKTICKACHNENMRRHRNEVS